MPIEKLINLNSVERNLEIGPFDESEAEALTELALDSKELYKALENLFRGDINCHVFMRLLELLSDSLHLNYVEAQYNITRDTYREVM